MTQKEKLTSLLSNASVGNGKFAVKDFFLPLSIEKLADELLSKGVIAPPISVGGEVHIIIEDKLCEGGIYSDPHTVTEVGSRGFWLSAYDPPRDDMSDFIDWSELGKTVFLSRQEAERAMKERNK